MNRSLWEKELWEMFGALKIKLEGWTSFRGSEEPLKDEMILLVDLQLDCIKRWIFCSAEVSLRLRNVALHSIGKDLQW